MVIISKRQLIDYFFWTDTRIRVLRLPNNACANRSVVGGTFARYI